MTEPIVSQPRKIGAQDAWCINSARDLALYLHDAWSGTMPAADVFDELTHAAVILSRNYDARTLGNEICKFVTERCPVPTCEYCGFCTCVQGCDRPGGDLDEECARG